MSDELDWFGRARETVDRLRAFEEQVTGGLAPKPVKRVASTVLPSTSNARSMNNKYAQQRIMQKRGKRR